MGEDNVLTRPLSASFLANKLDKGSESPLAPNMDDPREE